MEATTLTMKPSTLVILIIALSLSGSFLFTCILIPFSGEEAENASHLRVQVDELSREIDSLSAAHRDLNESFEALRAAVEGGPSLVPREPLMSVAVEVDRWIRKNRPDLVTGDIATLPSDTSGQLLEGLRQERAAQMLAMLDDPDLDEEEWSAAWKKISDAGLMDESLALLEDAVENDPYNPDAHMALAGGYLAKTTFADNDLEKGTWAIAADKTLDRVLELDPGHWEARFTKASTLTYYPPIMGKQGEAMKHFEVLLEQQKTLPPNPYYSQTYLYLGNLHQQLGNYQKASQIWKDGLAIYPDDVELAKQLENALKN
jgi:tetratricopeptide (TPR) repeat protein